MTQERFRNHRREQQAGRPRIQHAADPSKTHREAGSTPAAGTTGG